MGAPALLWPTLLPLLMVLFGQPPGTSAQDQVCSMNKTFFEVEENSNVPKLLANISVPEGLRVTLGPSPNPFAFKIVENQLFLNMTPDYEENSVLETDLQCKRKDSDSVVTVLKVLVIIKDVNDNAPEFPFTIKKYDVAEDTRVGTIIIPGTELEAKDADKEDTLIYTLQEVTPVSAPPSPLITYPSLLMLPGLSPSTFQSLRFYPLPPCQNASSFFSLMGQNNPSLRLQKTLDFYKNQNMTFKLLARDTLEEGVKLSHTATATLVLNVLPADLRNPWFLPCSFSDGYFCIQAQYHGVIPTGHILPSPLILSPGPIYAVDGDQGINQPVIYSIVGGNTNDIFIINKNSGNLTMAKSVPSSMNFTLLVRADQDDMARYSITQAIVEARSITGIPLQFSQSRYQGTVVLGSKAGTEVKDRTSPSEILRIQAQYPGFPDLNLAMTYRITNSSDFNMDADVILTTVAMEHADTFYVEVEATNTVTKDTATTVVEIQVSEQEPPTTESPTPPEAGGTTGPSSSTTLEAPTTSGTSQGPATTSSGGSAGPFPPSGTTLSPPASASSTPTLGISTSPQTATPGGGSTQTPKPGTSQPVLPITGTSTTTSQPATPSGGSTQTPKPGTSQPVLPITGTSTTTSQPATPSGGSTQTPKPGTSQPVLPITGTSTTTSQPATPSGGSTQTPKPGTSQLTAIVPTRSPSSLGEGQRFSTVDMAVLGGVLGALLLLALICLVILIHKHYRHRFNCCSGKVSKPPPQSVYDNLTFFPDHKASWSSTSNPQPQPGLKTAESPSGPLSPMSSSPTPPSSGPPTPELRAPGSPKTVQAGDSPLAVRSILTKERRPEGEGGYKAVWFGKDIREEADVVVLNEPAADMDSPSATESEDSDDDDPDQSKGSHLGADANTSYI
ncbi:cadherin-related family member 5 [Phodopus roborovskii]|uniref:cadherin-related family member 5 n=1 Tax=Phodopus roborovskii TaxID=109678 RepID=UPI0021E3D922|nr:cadherin-related family member 5 [Phodopus roborovskii]